MGKLANYSLESVFDNRNKKMKASDFFLVYSLIMKLKGERKLKIMNPISNFCCDKVRGDVVTSHRSIRRETKCQQLLSESIEYKHNPRE